MTQEERTLLLEIGELYQKLKDEPNGTYSLTRKCIIKPDGNNYVRNAQLLVIKVEKLNNNFNPEYLNEETLREFLHTFDKEVGYVESNYAISTKPSATKKANSEFIRSMYVATHQIEIDLYSLFNKIDEIKNE